MKLYFFNVFLFFALFYFEVEGLVVMYLIA